MINNEIPTYRDYHLDNRKDPIIPLCNFLNDNGFKTIIGYSDKAPLDLKARTPSVRITYLHDNALTNGGIDYNSIKAVGDLYEFDFIYYNQRFYQLDVYQSLEYNIDYPAGLHQPTMDIKILLMSPHSKRYLKEQGCDLCNINEDATFTSELKDGKIYLHRGILNFSILVTERMKLTDKKVKCVNTDLSILRKD